MPGLPPDPGLEARNWRKRAEQMLVIADTLQSGPAKAVLRAKAEDWFKRAAEIEREMKEKKCT